MNPATTRLLFPALLLIMVASSCSNPVDCYNRGIEAKVNGDLNSAERDFQKAVQINPNYAEAHFYLGAIILQKGRVDEAILHFKKALAINPRDANARKELDKAVRSKEQTILEADIPTGKLAFVTSAHFGTSGTISVVSGHRRVATPAYDTRELEFLPDGNRIIYCAEDSQAKGIYLYDLTQHTDFPLVTNVENATELFCGTEPSWSPDGARIAFVKDAQIYTAKIDGIERKQLTAGQYYNWIPRWSPDGRKLVFETTRNDTADTHGDGGHRDVYVMDGNGQNQINLTKKSYGHHPSWSPDGKIHRLHVTWRKWPRQYICHEG
jgi:Tol biopolymer transport system component